MAVPTLFWVMNFLMALSLDTHKIPLVQNIGCTWLWLFGTTIVTSFLGPHQDEEPVRKRVQHTQPQPLLGILEVKTWELFLFLIKIKIKGLFNFSASWPHFGSTSYPLDCCLLITNALWEIGTKYYAHFFDLPFFLGSQPLYPRCPGGSELQFISPQTHETVKSSVSFMVF